MTESKSRAKGTRRRSEEKSHGLRERISSQAEEAVGRLAQDLLENPLINSALQRAFAAGERAAQAQQTAMGALNLPLASDIEKLAKRLRSVSHRLEGVEDGLDRLEERLESLAGTAPKAPEAQRERAGLEQRLDRIQSRLDELGRDLTTLRSELSRGEGVSRDQGRLAVSES